MIRRLLILVIALVVGALIGAQVILDPGYVLISYGNYVLETSFWVGLLLLLIALLLILWLLSLRRRLRGLPDLARNRRKTRRAERSATKTSRGLQKLLCGDPAAGALLESGLSSSKLPLLNYLGAAYAAHEQGDTEKSAQWLAKSLDEGAADSLTIELTRAWLKSQEEDWEGVRSIISALSRKQQRNKRAQALLSRAEEALAKQQELPSPWSEQQDLLSLKPDANTKDG